MSSKLFHPLINLIFVSFDGEKDSLWFGARNEENVFMKSEEYENEKDIDQERKKKKESQRQRRRQ